MNNSQEWLSDLTTLARPDARAMLVIGFGGGIEDALVMLTLDDDGVRQFAAAPVNTDEHNRLAFFSRNAGDGLNADDMQEIFDSKECQGIRCGLFDLHDRQVAPGPGGR